MEAIAAANCTCFPEDGTVLRRFRSWSGRLHQRQDYPGKVFLALRRHEEDVLALTSEERGELWEAARIMRAGVARVLQPDRWNYLFLGNAVRHVHLHLIPRYATPHTIQGWTFADRHWGAMHARQEEPPPGVHGWLLARLTQALAGV